MSKKIQTILSLIEIAEVNLRNAKAILAQYTEDGATSAELTISLNSPSRASRDEEESQEVVEGYFDGENMIGDNSQIYLVPQNYASKTQLVIGDRMKWILTPTKEIFKLIQPAERERVTGIFVIEGDNYYVLVDKFTDPVRILKASATFAIKTQGLKIRDEVAILVPKQATPRWGAFVSVVKSRDSMATSQASNPVLPSTEEMDNFSFLDDTAKIKKDVDETDVYF